MVYHSILEWILYISESKFQFLFLNIGNKMCKTTSTVANHCHPLLLYLLHFYKLSLFSRIFFSLSIAICTTDNITVKERESKKSKKQGLLKRG